MRLFLILVGAIVVSYIIIQAWRQYRLRKLEDRVLDGTAQLRELEKARDAPNALDRGESDD